jgi:hypothetical protein
MPRLIAHCYETNVNLWGYLTWPDRVFPAFWRSSIEGKPSERTGRKATDLLESFQ